MIRSTTQNAQQSSSKKCSFDDGFLLAAMSSALRNFQNVGNVQSIKVEVIESNLLDDCYTE
jgi:hypothetical protein